MTYVNQTHDWEETASILRSIAHPIRLMILQELIDGARCVRDVQELFQISQPNLSQHLNALKNAGLIGYHVNGPLRCYYLIRPTLVKQLLDAFTETHPVTIRPKEVVIEEMVLNQKKKAATA